MAKGNYKNNTLSRIAVLLFSLILLGLVIIAADHFGTTHHAAISKREKTAYATPTTTSHPAKTTTSHPVKTNDSSKTKAPTKSSTSKPIKSPSPTAPIPPQGTLVQLPAPIASIVLGLTGPSSTLQYCSPSAAPLVSPVSKEEDFYLCVIRNPSGLVEVQLGWVKNTPVATLVPKGSS